jgi:glutathione S-transferase
MTDLILHHFDYSPFAEKARLAFGLKNLAWRSVQIPMIMPKPDLMPLSGGYGNRGLSLALTHWSDTAFFEPGAGLSMALTDQVPEAVITDRKQFFNFMNFDQLKQEVPHMLSQLRGNLALLEEQLTDGRAFLLGAQPGWADIACYFPVWMARIFVPAAAPVLEANPAVAAWADRVKAIGHGQRTDIDAQTALDIARDSKAVPGAGVDANDPLKLPTRTLVSVSPDDYGKVPVTGELVTLTLDEVAVKRSDLRVGEVVTHFPRLGYRVERATAR